MRMFFNFESTILKIKKDDEKITRFTQAGVQI